MLPTTTLLPTTTMLPTKTMLPTTTMLSTTAESTYLSPGTQFNIKAAAGGCYSRFEAAFQIKSDNECSSEYFLRFTSYKQILDSGGKWCLIKEGFEKMSVDFVNRKDYSNCLQFNIKQVESIWKIITLDNNEEETNICLKHDKGAVYFDCTNSKSAFDLQLDDAS